MARLRSSFPALAIFCLALLVRLVYNMTVAHGYIPEFDAGFYHHIAENLLQQHCYCVAVPVNATDRAPLWPLILTAIYFVAGVHNTYARLFLCFLGAGTCVLVYFFARELFGKRIAFFTGSIAAIYTGLFIYDGWLYSESVYTFTVTAACYSLFKLQRAWQKRWIVAGGLFIGLASLTRPNGLFMLGLVAVWAIIVVLAKLQSWRKVFWSFVLLVLVVLAVVAPWTVRNYQVVHTFVPVATGSGAVLAGSYNDTTLEKNVMGLGMWIPRGSIKPRPVNMHSCCDSEADKEGAAYALHWIRANLSKMPYLLSLHFINMWTPYTSEEGLPVREFPTRLSSKIVWAMMQIMPVVVFILAALGLLGTWRRLRKDLLVIYLMLLLTILVNVVFYGSMRFRAPVEPLLVLLAGGSIWWMAGRLYPFKRAML
ncbi:MAG: glycosyltransferase family 39 protein [Ktedonobacteraceae bacterium]|nr:glycosyltransferase family 39 protein [Ktedonobacteraceae bacterium]MBO0790972.1 glycosyltransferase family 39 protein [Ktedonobacteraceae bacterium]